MLPRFSLTMFTIPELTLQYYTNRSKTILKGRGVGVGLGCVDM